MCELFGMCCNVEKSIAFSLSGLLSRAKSDGPNKDGWGVAYYAQNVAHIVKEPIAAGCSPLAEFNKTFPIHSNLIISHIRRANRGGVCLGNTHPFSRELWGKEWVMAHNGQLKGIKKFRLDFYQPLGTTDSEHAFCWILGKLRKKYPKKPGSEKAVARLICECARKLGGLGVFNMLLSDSEKLYAHCSTRLAAITRQAPFAKEHLVDQDLSFDFAASFDPNTVMTALATKPLTCSDAWVKLKKGDFLVIQEGVKYNEDLKPI